MLKSVTTATHTHAGVSTPVGHALLPSTAMITVVEQVASLRALETDWRNLEAKTQRPCLVFQSFEWILAWSETYVTPTSGTALYIITGYDEGELVFAWPLMRNRTLGLETLNWVTDPFGQYGDVLVAKGQNTEAWLEAGLRNIKRLKGIDLLRLRHVRHDAHMAASAKAFFYNARVPEKAPCLDLKHFATEADYDARYTSTQRKRRKKIRKGLEELGPLQFTRLPNGTDAATAMEMAIAEKNAWLRERGRMNRVLGCPNHHSFLKRLSLRTKSNVDVVVTEMKAGEEPVSWEIGFRHGKTHYGYITSHVNAHTDLSPGRLHMDHSQRAALAAGMECFDLMVPNDAHKESWSSHAVETEDYYVPLSWLGSVVGHGYLRTIRPLLRSLYYKLEHTHLRRFSLRHLWAGKAATAAPARDE